MAKAKKQPMSAEFDGRVLVISKGPKDDKEVVRRYDANDVPRELHEQLFLFGFKTKVQNYKSGSKEKGRDPLEMMDEGFERLCDGEWVKERESSGPTVSPAVEALARLKGKPIPAIQKKLGTYGKEKRRQILANPDVVALAQQIAKEREAAVDVDLDDMVEWIDE